MRARSLAFTPLLLIGLAGTLRGAPAVTLGPEVALSQNRDSGPAAFAQVPAPLVTDGDGFVVSWVHLYDLDLPRFELRLDPGGEPLEPFARRIDDYRGYASTGHGDYLALWRDDHFFWVQRVDTAGAPAGPPSPIHPRSPYSGVSGLFANGNCYLLVVNTGDPAKFSAILLDRIGRIIQRRELDFQYFLTVAPFDGGFVISGCDGSPRCAARLSTLSNSGRLTRLATPGLPDTSVSIMRASDDRLMIAWWEKVGVARLMILGFDGNVLKPPFPIPIPAESGPTALLWDGRELLLLLHDFGDLVGKLQGIRLNGSGDRLSAPFLLSETAVFTPSFAASETTGLLMWADTRFSAEPDLVGLRFRYFSELEDSLDRATLIARSPAAQSAVQLAASGSHTMAVWMNEPSHTISGWIDGTEFNVTSAPRREVNLPAVAASPNGFLVAWNEFSSADDGSLFVRRYALDGTPLEEQPVEIFTHVPRSSLKLEGQSWGLSKVNQKPALMYDGTSFVLFAAFTLNEGNAYAMRIARVDPQSGAVTTSSVPLSTRSFGFLRPVTTPAGWYVPFAGLSFGAPFHDPPMAISVATVRDGTVHDVETPYHCSAEDCATFSAASAQGNVTQLFLWNGISLWRSTPAGESLGKPIDVSDCCTVIAGDIAWNGSEYVAAWILFTGTVRVRRFAADGTPLDPEAFTIATNVEAVGLSIAVTPAGVAIAYSRRDDAYGSVPRARMRTLGRLGR